MEFIGTGGEHSESSPGHGLLRDTDGLVLIEAGFTGGLARSEQRAGWEGTIGSGGKRHRLLFCADLFASFFGFTHLPPAIFNSDGAAIPASARKALALDLDGILPNHGDGAAPEVHLSRLIGLARPCGII